MAFNFLGTINSREEFDEFEEFVNKEYVNIDRRIKHLEIEKQRLLELSDKFLVADITLRAGYSKSDLPDASWLEQPRQSVPKLYKIPDALNGEDVNLLKRMFLDSIKAKRERNEFKVKKILDLIEQVKDEINFLTEEKENYAEALNRIKSRFNLPQFTEVQDVAKEDPEDIKKMRSDFGLEETEDSLGYMVTAINSVNNSIVFERAIPPVKPGDIFALTNGKNNGLKTVVKILSHKAVVVAEPLEQETPSQSFVVFSKG